MEDFEANNSSTQKPPPTDGESWAQLSANVRTLALRKSAAMIDAIDMAGNEEGETESFNADSRTLRLLMSAADIVDRMKRREAQEKDPNEKTTDVVSYEAAQAAYRQVRRVLDEAGGDEISNDAQGGGTRDDQGGPAKRGGEDLGPSCS